MKCVISLKNIEGGGTRNSCFELLRLLCIFGIVYMHTYGIFYETASGDLLIHGVIINSVFNMGVSLFMLISGYFGVKQSGKKMFFLLSETFFYSILGVVVTYILKQESIGLRGIIEAVMPFSSKRYWYITAYLILMSFASYINRVPDKLSKEEFQGLIKIMFILFSLLPTVTFIHVMGDRGKGPVNMLMMYFIGRYIRMHVPEQTMPRKRILLFFLMIFISEIGLNIFCSFIKNKGMGLYCPYAQDYTVFIVAGSILIFLLFKYSKMNSKTINMISKHVLGIYLTESMVREVFGYIGVGVESFREQWFLFGIIAVHAVAIMMICILIDIIREHTVERFLAWVYNKISNRFHG